ncbi:MAG: helix-turn-helix domain-containing protein [Bacteroidota bacterium]
MYTYNRDYNELWYNKESKTLQKSNPHFFLQNTIFDKGFIVSNTSQVSSPTVILPDLSAYIIIHCLQNGNFRVRIVGPRTESIFINRRSRYNTLIFRLKHFALYYLSSVPMKEFTDRSVDIEDIFGVKIKQGILMKLDTEGFENIFDFLSKEITLNYWKDSSFMSACLTPELNNIKTTVQSTARSLGVSSRYFQKICNTQLGMPPKMMLKVKRLISSLHLKSMFPEMNYAHLAVASGYFDQSHMIDDYQQFIQNTPVEIFG